MAIYRWLVLGLVIFILQIARLHGEIHRAKSISSKIGSKSGRLARDSPTTTDRQHGHPDTSDSHDGAVTTRKQNAETLSANIDMPEFELTRTQEVWLYSILASIAVGLSGIFPLLVIPIEAGPALKHGGKSHKE
jgi:hypothetical protein